MEPERNLLIITSHAEDISDWTTIKMHIETKAPDIDVRLMKTDSAGAVTRRWLRRKPSLTVSVHEFDSNFRNPGGKTYAGRPLTKLEQAAGLKAAGIPTPRSLEYFPGVLPKADIWGEYLIAKPIDLQTGIGVRLVKTAELNSRIHAIRNLPGVGNSRLMVQQFIDHTDSEGHPVDYRALMFFGEPLYLHRRRWTKPRPSAEVLATELSPQVASNFWAAERDRVPVNDAEVVALASRACAVYPDIPAIGLDIVRERGTEKLYVIELNTRGNWHLSSPHAKRDFPPALREATYRQFNACETAADLLIQKTRDEAR
jgi:hypothetical protein